MEQNLGLVKFWVCFYWCRPKNLEFAPWTQVNIILVGKTVFTVQKDAPPPKILVMIRYNKSN